MKRCILSLSLLGALCACAGTDTPTPKDTGATTVDTDTNAPDAELACDDGLDNDEDGLADCADPDCDSTLACSTPQAMSHQLTLSFEGWRITCDDGSGPQPYEVSDCATVLELEMARVNAGVTCPDCDATYAGSVAVVSDDCEDTLGLELPGTLNYGVDFTSRNQRGLWELGDDGWQETLTLEAEESLWTGGDTAVVEADLEGCDNGVQALGAMTRAFSFQDL